MITANTYFVNYGILINMIFSWMIATRLVVLEFGLVSGFNGFELGLALKGLGLGLRLALKD